MLVRATELRHAYGDRVTLASVSFSLEPRSRVALTGRNGAGKTTLLRILNGQLRAESGALEWAPDVRVGYLEQDPDFGSETVSEVIGSALRFVRGLETRLRDLEQRISTDADALMQWSVILDAFERAGGYSAHARAAQVMAALELDGFQARVATSLSGGERTRLALAAVLVNQPDLLILDEPTNHLDIRMREWLERTLLDYPGAILIVSHDRNLLDAVCQETFHLEHGSLAVFPGGYTASRLQRLELRRVQDKQHRVGRFELKRLERSSKQVAAWGVNNDKLARRAKALRTRAGRTRDALVEAPAKERRIVMSLQSGTTRAETILRAEHLTKSYEGHLILEDAGLRIRAGDRIALLAPNGAGKTTLLRLLLGEIPPDAARDASSTPEIRYADGAVPAHFDQTYHGLNPNRAVLEQLSDRVGEGAAKALLGRYAFRSEDWYKLPRQLSGGERARAGLALIAATRADVLILDEPTNHLDVETLETLEDALLGYPGSLLFVTHDRAFARNVATRVFGIEGRRVLEYLNGFDGYERARRGDRQTLDPARLLEHEIEPRRDEKPLTMDQHIQLLEERLTELEELFLHRVSLTERDWERLRAERTLARARLQTLYAQQYAAPLEYDFETRHRKQPVRAFSDDDRVEWRFWIRGSHGCPSLGGRFERGVMTLRWLDEARGMMPWFRTALLNGARSIAFEHVGATRLHLPPEENQPEHSSLEYAKSLGLLRPVVQIKRKRSRRRRKKPSSPTMHTSPDVAASSLIAPNPSSLEPPQAIEVPVQLEARGGEKRKRRRRRKAKLLETVGSST
jgi:ATPase subunit of ABC transporter with duplicated ATPase domains